MSQIVFVLTILATQAPEELVELVVDPRAQTLATLASVGIVFVRVLMKLARSNLVQKLVLERLPMLPEELRPTALFAFSLLLSSLAGFLDHLINGGTLLEALLAGCLVFLGAEGTYRIQKGVSKLSARRVAEKDVARAAAGVSLSLADRAKRP